MKNSIKLRGTPDQSQTQKLGTIQTWGEMDLTTPVYSAAQVETRIGDINTSVSQYIADHVSSAYIFKGSCAYDALPTTGQKVGDVYNVTDDFILDGEKYTAGTDVAWIEEGTGEQKTGKWNALGGKTFDDSGVIKSVTLANSGTVLTPATGEHGITIPNATTSDAGLMSATDKTKLDEVAKGAQVNVIETVKVDNVALTPDANKAVNIDLSGKANQSEMAIEDVTGDATKKTITLKKGLSQDVVVAHQDISGKADKVANATSGNFAGLDSTGNLTDSGSKATDFATAAQGAKADSAVQGVKLAGADAVITLDSNKIAVIPTAVATGTGETNGLLTAADKKKLDDLATTYKPLQTAVEDTAVSGKYVSQVAQNAEGVITVTRADLPAQVQSDWEQATTTAADYIKNKPVMDGAYDASTNKVATQSTVTTAVAALDAEVTSSDGTNVQVKVTQVDGVVTAVNITSDTTASKTHTHGNISNDGKVGTDSGKVLVTGEGGAVIAGELDGTYSETNKVATQKTVTDAIAALDVTEVSVGASKTVDKISETDGKISVTTTDIQITEGQVTDLTTHLAAKANKVTVGPGAATAGNFFQISSTGDLEDSGKKATDFQPAGNYKTTQTAVEDTAVEGQYVSKVDQNANGVISVTRVPLPSQTTYTLSGSGATVTLTPTTGNVEGTPTSHTIPDATTSAKGVVQLTDATNSTSTTTAATANAVKLAKDAADAADTKVSAVNTAAANLLTALNDTTKVSKTMNTANDIKAVVGALITALKTFAGAADNA